MLKTTVITRWNSLYDSLLDLLTIIENNKGGFDTVVSQFKISPFTNMEIEYIKNLVKAFEPIAIALDIVQGDNDVYSGISIPLVLKTLSKLEVLKANGQSHLKFLSQSFLDSIKKRFENIISNIEMQCATALHPKFKFKFFEKYIPDIVNDLKTKIENEFNNINNNSDNNINNNHNGQSSSSNESQSFFDSDEEDATTSEFGK